MTTKRFFDVPLDKHPEEPPKGCDHVFRTCESVKWCVVCGWQGSDPNWQEEPMREYTRKDVLRLKLNTLINEAFWPAVGGLVWFGIGLGVGYWIWG